MIWVDHINRPDPQMLALLAGRLVACHPFVIGELALGNLHDRSVLLSLAELPRVNVASDDEVISFIEVHRLHGAGIGYVDAHLLVSARLSDDTSLWTRDRRLKAMAERMEVAADLGRLQ